MQDLIRQAQDPTEIRGREGQVSIIRFRSGDPGIRYVTHQKQFLIAVKNGSPCVHSNWPVEHNLPAGHATHYFGNGNVCVGRDLDVPLHALLHMIDGWACAFQVYLKTGTFPDDPRESFKRIRQVRNKENRANNTNRQGNTFWSTIRRVF